MSGLPAKVPPQSYAVPPGATLADFAVSAEQDFINKMGLSVCIAGGENPVVNTLNITQQYTPTANAIPYITLTAYVTYTKGVNGSMPQGTSAMPSGITLKNIVSSTSATLTTSASSTSYPLAIQPSSSDPTSSGLGTGVRVGIGIAVPVGIIALFMLATYLWRKDQRQRREALKPEDVWKVSEDTSPPFLQQKPELDAQQRRHEVEAKERRHELDPGCRRHELPAGDRRQELRGEDHSQELEVPTEQ